MKLGDWVPQIFYDLIGRVVPGAFLTLLGIGLFCKKEQIRTIVCYLFEEPGVPLSFILLGSILLFYIIGILLGGIGFAVAFREWEQYFNRPWFPVQLPDEKNKYTGLPYIYDAIQLRWPQVGARCAKLQAEAHMCRVLLIGFLSFLGVWIVSRFSYIGQPEYWLVIACLFIGCATTCLFHIHLSIRTQWLLVNHWYLLQLNNNSKAEDPICC